MSAGMLQISELQARVRLCHGHLRKYFSTFVLRIITHSCAYVLKHSCPYVLLNVHVRMYYPTLSNPT